MLSNGPCQTADMALSRHKGPSQLRDPRRSFGTLPIVSAGTEANEISFGGFAGGAVQ
jgi:hypothetical protein